MITREVKQQTGAAMQLDQILDKKHALYQLADRLNWEQLINSYGPYYCENNGRPSVPIRVIAGLHYIKYLEDLSDEDVVAKFCENPYWQYFCGFDVFQHRLPCHYTSLIKWRKKVGIDGVEKLLKEVIDTAFRVGFITEESINDVTIDTTVQEKAIAFPTDSKIFHKMREHLVAAAKEKGIKLRQTYCKASKDSLLKQGYAKSSRKISKSKERKKIKNYLGRVIRDISRQHTDIAGETLSELLVLAKSVFERSKNSKDKIYSLHAPEVECISKGKAHKKYEFGCKVSLAITNEEPWIVSISAEHGNPFDGATLSKTVDGVEKYTGVRPKNLFVDRGYRGKNHHPSDANTYLTGTKLKDKNLKRKLRFRVKVEPIISHLKHDFRMLKNYLLGKTGDSINAILSACAFNLKKMMRMFDQQNLAESTA